METRPLNPHDRLFRFAFADLALVRDFVTHYLPSEISAELDVSTLASVEGTFIDETLNQHVSDALFRVGLRHHDGDGLLYILIEHKSYADRMTARQMLRYVERIWSHEERTNPQKTSLTPILPVVLFHGEGIWNAPQELVELLDVPAAYLPYMPRLRFLLWDLNRTDTNTLVETVQLRLFVRLIELFQADDILARIPELGALLRELTEPKTVLEWVKVGLIYLSANARLGRDDVLEIARRLLPADDDEGEAIMSSIAEVWYQDGLEKGREEGRETGREEGLLQATMQILSRKFGDVPPSVNDVLASHDAAYLNKALTAALDAPDLDAFVQSVSRLKS